MLPEINLFLASVLALSWVVGFIVLPFLFLWIALSIRRDLCRIAESLSQTTRDSVLSSCRPTENTLPVVVESERRILNSLFGR